MTLNEAYTQVANYFNNQNFSTIEHLKNFDTKEIPTGLVGKVRQAFDFFGRSIEIGDVVSYGRKGSYKGLCVGIIIGYTTQGFRIIPLWKDQYKTLKTSVPGKYTCSNENTIFDCTVIQKCQKI